jgi:glycosyltransferase involved in cell wall biosynthesis
MKVDLHLHSNHSKRPSQWVLQKICCPESFSEPAALMRQMQRQGMSAFTLTDHNTIGGCLEIAHLPGVFISEEVTTYFPEDGCKVHVVVYDIDENKHRELQEVRQNIHDLTAYLRDQGLVHTLAHPLFSVNDRLNLEHFEKFLLLFKNLELNGARDDFQNRVIRMVAENLTRRDIEELAERHGLEPIGREPWVKGLTGGSDDHSALHAARMVTEVPRAQGIAEFLTAVGQGRGRPVGRGSEPVTLAHNLYGIAYQYYNSKFPLEKYAGRDVLMLFLDRLLKPESQASNWLPIKLRGFFGSRRRRLATSDKIQDVIRYMGETTITDDPELFGIIREGARAGRKRDEQWYTFVNQAANKVMHRFGSELYGHLSGANVFSIFSSIGAAGSLYTMLAPYFVSYGLFSRDRGLVDRVARRFTPPGVYAERPLKVAHFTDTFYEINGVAWTLRQQARLAEENGKDLTIVTCAEDDGETLAGRVRNFKPIEVFDLPEYPEMKLFLPPILEMLRWVYDQGINYIHSATPGPVGLAALAIARMLKIPISGTYHTAIPEYARHLTGDDAVEHLVWKYAVWYYDQMEMIYVPSHDTGAALAEKGLDPKKIRLYPRGVDTEAFHPRHRGGFYERRYGLRGVTKLLYVGRVSKEKNLPLLAGCFKTLCGRIDGLHLVVVGDGPWLAEMQAELAGRPCTFTGYLQGQDLAEAFAGADLFVFPSTTDTFGNVILEAQASGLPVIVTDQGGPRENMIPGQTGLAVPGNDGAALIEALADLAEQPLRLRQMGKAARTYMESRSFKAAFREHWNMYSCEHADFTASTDPVAKAV